MSEDAKRIAIIGAGPIGLEAAHALAADGHDVHVYEQGATVAESVRQWGHVTLFSPWHLNVSEIGLTVLDDLEVPRPAPDRFPTGADYVASYLEPLANHPRLSDRISTGTHVLSIGREDVLKGELIGSQERCTHAFRLLVEDGAGERIERADVVLDTSGTYSNPNAIGNAGIPAPGERAAMQAGLIEFRNPDIRGAARDHYAGRKIVLIGAGYSAATSLSALLDVAAEHADTHITWLTRDTGAPYDRLEDDPLPQRDALSAIGNTVAVGAHDQNVDRREGVHVERMTVKSDGSLDLYLSDGTTLEGVERVIANVGFRPDPDLYRELQVHQCYASEGPMKLAAALLSAGGGGDCLAQTSQGADTLKSPEPDFFILGVKSYGRRSDFLLKLGLAQINEVRGLING